MSRASNESDAEQPSRYVVGIDLGTTNSAVGYVDTTQEAWQVRTFPVPQLVAAGEVEARETLPSFHYEAAEAEFAPGALKLPWDAADRKYTVGFFARDHGAMVPGRLIASAKSWLSHSGVDRTADVLPWHGASDVERLSPVEVSARYLAHIREAWNHAHPKDLLEAQDIVLTLPASFDEVARELTVKAAARAGLTRVVLIEEPQAAFYAWIHAQGDNWEGRVQPGQKILVCDIGGGTSDFTLIRVRQGSGGKVQFHRVAVGEHLILGGDNLDLALAHHLESRLASGGKLEPRAWAMLVRNSRRVKETLLGPAAPQQTTLNLPGTGSRLIGSGLTTDVTREETEALLVDGFFPQVALADKPAQRRSGFQEFGLPYAPDPAITRYLAAFLSAHRHVAMEEAEAPTDHDPARPDIVLFNGGVFESPVLRHRLLQLLSDWFSRDGTIWQPLLLENERLDLAVAHGAAYYGMVRRGVGVRISAGLARAYYIGVGSSAGGTAGALCLVPAGVEEGQGVDLLEHRFRLLIRQPVEFPLYVSSTRLTDKAGELVDVDTEQMTPLPPIRTVLQSGKKGAAGEAVNVNLHARLSEIGTLELWCGEVDGPRRWRVQFDVRAATQTDVAGHLGVGERAGLVDEELLDACRSLIRETFAQPSAKSGDPPDGLMKRLSAATQMSRQEWPPTLLRGMWEELIAAEPGRRLSQNHEGRWLNLTGFALRPGYGLAVDDWRVAQTWRAVQGKIYHGGTMVRAEWWVLWRRIAGGLAAGQQRSLADPLIAEVRSLHRSRVGGVKGRAAEFSFGSHEAAEVWRLLGSLELLSMPSKVELGGIILDLLPREKVSSLQAASLWALGRLGARIPVYGPLNTVVPTDVAQQWLLRLMSLPQAPETATLAVMQLARRTGDRFRDISDSLREQCETWLRDYSAPAHFQELVRLGGELAEDEQAVIFGESLPAGLTIA